MAACAGTYTRDKVENLDNFLDAMGFGLLKRKAAAAMTPKMIITEVGGGKWNVLITTAVSTVSNVDIEFGGETETTDMQGTKRIMRATKDGDTWTFNQTAVDPKDPDQSTVRRFVEDGVHVDMSCGGVTSKQFWKRQK